MLEDILDIISRRYSTVRVDEGEFGSFSVNGMDFENRGYDLKDLGRVSLMKASGMGGAMTMETLIVNPFEVDVPLYSADIISAGGADMLILELYDTCLDPHREETAFRYVLEKYAELPDMPTEARWYVPLRYGVSAAKRVPKAEAEKTEGFVRDYSEAYLKLLAVAVHCDPEKKRAKAREYSDGLIEHGGTSTDAFLSAWGREKTKEFFDRVLFG